MMPTIRPTRYYGLVLLVPMVSGCTQLEIERPAGEVRGGRLEYQDQRLTQPLNHLPNPYIRVQPWGELPSGDFDIRDYEGRPSFIGAEEGPDGHIYALTRCMANSCTGRSEPPLLKYDADGRILLGWGEGMFDFPHGLYVHRDGSVWTADQRGHTVYKFSPDGELLMTIGERGTAGYPPYLNEPTDVAVAPNGEIFISEGHSNSPDAAVARISKFAPDGTFLKSWGGVGSAPGQFSTPHTLAFDSRGRLFVGDRNNNRIQIFDQEGNVLDLWYQFGRPSGIAISSEDRIYVADSESWDFHNPGWKKGIRIGSARDGTVEYFIEDIESMTISHSGAEGIGIDSQGNIYGSVVRRRMLEKFVPQAGMLTSGPAAEPLPATAAATHLAHVTRGFGGAPDGRGLAVTAGREVNQAMRHANLAALSTGNLEAMKAHARHVLHAIDPAEVVEGPGLGVGVVAAVQDLARHLSMAAESAGASESMRRHADHVGVAAAAVVERGRAVAALARRLESTETAAAGAALAEELRVTALRLDTGFDADGSGRIDLPGEAGMTHVEDHIYLVLEGERLPRILQ